MRGLTKVLATNIMFGAFGTAMAAELPAGFGWHELPNTKLGAVCPPNGFGDSKYEFSNQCGSVTGAWSGGTYDPVRKQLLIWGGGHDDYYGNEVYALSLESQKMSRITDPATPTQADIGKSVCASELPPNDGTQPNSRHTYDGITYMENIGRMFAFSGSRACGGGSADNAIFLFDPSTLKWQRQRYAGDTPKGGDSLGSTAAYDSVSGKVYFHDTGQLFSFEAGANGVVRKVGGARTITYSTTAEIDPKLRTYVVFGRGVAKSFDLTGTKGWINLTARGCDGLVSAKGPGLTYNPSEQKVVGWAGGNTIYLYDVQSDSCTTQSILGGPPSVRNGTHGRFQYAAELGAYVVVNSVDDNAFILRLEKLQSPKPPTELITD